jgi:predicted RNase H-like HicB family nuclease
MNYPIIIETTTTGFSAYAPTLPGCIATGKTLKQVRQRMREAIEFHIEGLRLNRLPVPEPTPKAILSSDESTALVDEYDSNREIIGRLQ